MRERSCCSPIFPLAGLCVSTADRNNDAVLIVTMALTIRCVPHGPLAPSQVDDIVYLFDDVLVFPIALLSRSPFCQGSIVFREYFIAYERRIA